MPARTTHYWIKIRRPDGVWYFLRFMRHHPTIKYAMARSYEAAYCFASAEDAQRIADVLKAVGVDAVVSWKPVVTLPPLAPSPGRASPKHLEMWIDRILEVGSALGKSGRNSIDAGYRALAHEHHPDHGGRVADMQLVTDARNWLHKYYEDDVPF